MANDDFTSNTKRTCVLDTNSYDKAHLMLARAHGILDVLFTLDAEGSTEGLMKHSLANTLDAVMEAIAQAQELLSLRDK